MARLKASRLAVLSLLVLTQTSSAQARKMKRQSSENNLISSGTCYYGPGQQADSAYIPCGNTAFGNFHCCEAQSNCLDNNACYDGDQGTTYLAGCTDPTYKDASCPSRGIYSAQQWSGLVYCNGTSDEWTLCDDSSAASNLVVAVPGCYCPTDAVSRNVAFNGPATLGSQVVLPASTGESMSVFPGFTLGTVLTSTPSPTTTTTTPTTTTPTPPPTTTSSVKQTTSTTTSKPPNAIISTTSFSIPSTSSSSGSSSTSSSLRYTTTSSSQSSSSTSSSSAAAATTSAAPGAVVATSGLSTGAKAGIGAAAGILLLGFLAFLAVCLRRRKRRSTLSAGPTPEVQPMSQYQQQYQQEYQTEPTASPHRYSPAWSTAAKSELVGDTSTSSPSIPQSNWSRPLSEAEGSYPTYQSMASLRTSELGGSGAYQQSRPYQAATTSSTSQGSYRPGRRMEGGESGLYEMPAQLPGSTMM